MKQEMTREPFTTEIPELSGKVVARAYQESGECHSLDSGYEQDGTVVVEFTDGTKLVVISWWCNDSTASTEYTIEGEA